METKTFTSVRIADVTGASGFARLRASLGVEAFGINATTAGEAGAELINEHDEKRSGHQEVYIVVAGHATFTVDGDELDAPQGAVVLVHPEGRRSAVAVDAGTTLVMVGAKPGEAFAPRAWETNAEVIELFGENRVAEAKVLLEDARDRFDDESIVYNLACCDARLGNPDAAFEHLREALAERPDLVELARGDDDLAALRGDPRFEELVGTAS